MRALLLLISSALGWALLIVGIHRESPRTAVSAHGLLHGAIAQRFTVDGWSVPPENPLFAGEPLPYYWTFHALGAGTGQLLGLDPLRSFELWIVTAVVVFVLGCGALARSLYGRPALGALIALLALVGANLQAPLVLGVRTALSGGAVLEDPGGYLWGVAHPLLGHMRLWDPFATLGPLLPFFLNVTARPLALAALVLVLVAVVRCLRLGWRGALPVAAATAVCTALSVLIGVPAALALGGGLLLAPRLSLDARGAGRPPDVAPPIAGLALGIAIGALPVLHLFGGQGTGASVSLASPATIVTRALGMVACAWPLMLGTTLSLAKSTDATRLERSALALAAAALCAGTALFELPAGNHVNLFHAALVLLAATATGALVDHRGTPSPKRIAWAVAACLPVLALVVAAYTGRPEMPIAFEGTKLRRSDETHAARLYEWIRATTAPDTVLVIDPGRPIRAMGGNTAELPVLTERTLFTARDDHYLVVPHPAAATRAAIARALLAGDALVPTAEQLVAGLERPVLLVVDAATRVARPARLEARYGPAAFTSGPVSVWPWRPSRAAAEPSGAPAAKPPEAASR